MTHPDHTRPGRRPARTARLIGLRLDVSERTARRYLKKGIVEGYKLGGQTSPWNATDAAIERARQRTRED